MFEIGRVCMKLAGRDAGRTCVIVEEVDKNHVLVDGDVRRRKCNRSHLEPLGQVLKLKSGASHEEVAKLFKAELGIELKEKKPKVKPDTKKAPAKAKEE